MSGDEQAESWRAKNSKVDFHSLAGNVSLLLARLGVISVAEERFTNQMFEYGLVLKQGKKELGRIGKLSKALLRDMEVRQEVFFAEMDWDMLSKRYDSSLQVSDVSKFPEVRRDLSLVVDRSVTYAEMRKVAMQTERKLLRSLNAFDVYEGDKMAAGKKAVSISFILQDQAQTLSDKVIDKTMNRLIEGFEKELGAEIRR